MASAIEGTGAPASAWLRARLAFAFFLVAMSPGCWVPSLTNIMRTAGMAEWVPLAFAVGPMAGLLSPVWGGALADNRFRGEKLLGWIAIGGTGALGIAFFAVDAGWPAWLFVSLLALNSLITAPMWSLMTSVALAHLPDPEREFPLVRLGGTLGWIAGGLLVSHGLLADASPEAGYAGTAVRFLAGVACLTLPATLPKGSSRSWRTLFGLDALRLLRQRDHAVFFLTSGLFSIPLMAFFMYTPAHLQALGDPRATGTMALGQLTEIVAMLAIGLVMVRARVKTILVWALALSALRFGLCGVAEIWGGRPLLVVGVMLHGVCYTFFFITAQIFLDRRVEPGFRGQAQALMALVTAGLGSLAGSFVVGAVHGATVRAGIAEGWLWFWTILAASIVAITIFFVVLYRGIPVPPTKKRLPPIPLKAP